MKVHWGSSLYSFTSNFNDSDQSNTVSKMVTTIKLKSHIIFDMTKVQSSREFIRQIFLSLQQLLYLGGERSVGESYF